MYCSINKLVHFNWYRSMPQLEYSNQLFVLCIRLVKILGLFLNNGIVYVLCVNGFFSKLPSIFSASLHFSVSLHF